MSSTSRAAAAASPDNFLALPRGHARSLIDRLSPTLARDLKEGKKWENGFRAFFFLLLLLLRDIVVSIYAS